MSLADLVGARGDLSQRTVVGLWQSERTFRVMGTDAHVLTWQEPYPLTSPEDLLDLAEAELARLEDRWSRFRLDSDVSRINIGAGRAVAVAPETVDLLRWAQTAYERTGACFDPTLLTELVTAGYDRPFDDLPPRRSGLEGHEPAAGRRLPRPWPVDVDPDRGTASTSPDRLLDLGGVGKGRAADMVAARLVQEGALGACVNLGGDLRVTGATPEPEGIIVAVEDPFVAGRTLTSVRVANAAVATSSCRRRRWRMGDDEVHHLIDPRTGRPARTGIAAATVVAPSAAWAEVGAKVAVLAGAEQAVDRLADLALSALIITEDGAQLRVGDFERFEP